jgi:hypothetical protein
VKGRPAETSSAAGSLALVLAVVLGVRSPTTLAAIGVVIGLIPAAVTLLVVHGGIRGVLRLIWRGRGA